MRMPSLLREWPRNEFHKKLEGGETSYPILSLATSSHNAARSHAVGKKGAKAPNKLARSGSEEQVKAIYIGILSKNEICET